MTEAHLGRRAVARRPRSENQCKIDEYRRGLERQSIGPARPETTTLTRNPKASGAIDKQIRSFDDGSHRAAEVQQPYNTQTERRVVAVSSYSAGTRNSYGGPAAEIGIDPRYLSFFPILMS